MVAEDLSEGYVSTAAAVARYSYDPEKSGAG